MTNLAVQVHSWNIGVDIRVTTTSCAGAIDTIIDSWPAVAFTRICAEWAVSKYTGEVEMIYNHLNTRLDKNRRVNLKWIMAVSSIDWMLAEECRRPLAYIQGNCAKSRPLLFVVMQEKIRRTPTSRFRCRFLALCIVSLPKVSTGWRQNNNSLGPFIRIFPDKAVPHE